jgi:hypothetical protein
MTTLEYRGFIIKTHRTDKWSALILRPGSSPVRQEIPTATSQEGEATAIERAKAFIDKVITAENEIG